ncbi:MAG: hypothetical protein GXZ08_00730 [Tissierellia bacterium]|nr:hypothetical protein [Tissierellia bacterium]
MKEINFFEEDIKMKKVKVNKSSIYIMIILAILIILMCFDYLHLKNEEKALFDEKSELISDKELLTEQDKSLNTFNEKSKIIENYCTVSKLKEQESEKIKVVNMLENSINENLMIEKIADNNSMFTINGYCNSKNEASNLNEKLNSDGLIFNLENIKFEDDYYSFMITKDDIDGEDSN